MANVSNYYSTSSYRLSSSLIANGHELAHVRVASSLEKTSYFFKDSKELRKAINKIEDFKDQVSSRDLYTAMDYLAKRSNYESIRAQFDRDLFEDTKESKDESF